MNTRRWRAGGAPFGDVAHRLSCDVVVVKRCLSLEELLRAQQPAGQQANVLLRSLERHTLLFRETEGKRAAERSLQQFGLWLELNPRKAFPRGAVQRRKLQQCAR